MTTPLQPDNPRHIGRSRAYTAATIPERLHHWHAPRINRWEHLCVTAGQLTVEWLGATGISKAVYAAGERQWFASGTRWRVANIPRETSFALDIYADAKGRADEPQMLRSTVLQHAPRLDIDNSAAFHQCARTLPAGERRLVTAHFTVNSITADTFADRRLFWHPLEVTTNGFVALLARARRDFDLGAYLGRDHAVIEATLAATLADDRNNARWLHATLERHLQIEEQILFPAYVAAGGNKAWVRGLLKEHGYLREYLASINQSGYRRKFLRLLDGHDEKEERVVYPDVLAHLGDSADALLRTIIRTPAPSQTNHKMARPSE